MCGHLHLVPGCLLHVNALALELAHVELSACVVDCPLCGSMHHLQCHTAAGQESLELRGQANRSQAQTRPLMLLWGCHLIVTEQVNGRDVIRPCRAGYDHLGWLSSGWIAEGA